jgi:hypothetical protein
MSGCGGRNAGAIARARCELFSGLFVRGKIFRGQAKERVRGFLATFVAAGSDRTLVQKTSAVSYPALCSVTASGHLPAPGGSLLFCFDLHRPVGYGFRSKSVREVQRKISPEPP